MSRVVDNTQSRPKPPHFVVLGGNGGVGKIFSKLMRDRGFNVTTVDPHGGDIKKDVKSLSKDTLFNLSKDNPLWIVNLLPHMLNREVLEWLPVDIIKGYTDFSVSSVEMPIEQRQYEDKLKEICSVINVGLGPGIINLMGADLVRKGAKRLELYYLEDLSHYKMTWGVEEFREDLGDPAQYSIRDPNTGKLTLVTADDLSYAFNNTVDVEFYYGTHSCMPCTADELYSLTENFPHLEHIRIYAGGLEFQVMMVLARLLEQGVDLPEDTPQLLSRGIKDPVSRFSMVASSESLRHEIALPTNPPMGTPITYNTALAGVIFILNAISDNLPKGMYFPENLPADLQKRIIRDFIVESGAFVPDYTKEAFEIQR